jgi:hypothetical protein
MTIRSHDASQSSWSLIGLAVRIAHALGLHRDGDGKAFTPFHAEMRRRLWWEILVLDGRASEDRGTESMILDGSFNTIMPHNLNDEDFNMTIRALPPSKVGITEMTFCLICMDVCNTILKISFIPPFKEHHVLTFQQKEELVKACAGRIDSYLAGSSPSDPNTWMVCSVGQLLVLRLWLVLQYPLQSVHSSSQHFARGQSLRTATAYMKLAEALEVADASACFVWFFKTYVPWHALAVALAELCNETQGPLADDAWDIIAKGYDKWVERMADSKGGMLWRPVKSLMKKARAARERGQELAEPRSGSFQSAPEQTLSGGNIQIDPLAPTIDQSHSLDPHYFSSSDLAPQTMYSSFGLDFLNLADYIAPASTGHLEDLPDWNLWDQFVSDVGEPCGDSHILPFR